MTTKQSDDEYMENLLQGSDPVISLRYDDLLHLALTCLDERGLLHIEECIATIDAKTGSLHIYKVPVEADKLPTEIFI